MPSSLLTQVTLAFGKVLLTLAQVYELALTGKRDSWEKDLFKASKRVALKAHPDKGGTDKDFKTFQAAREKWEVLRTTRAERPVGRRWGQARAEATVASVVGSGSAPESYRVRGCSVSLSYHGFSDCASWKEFLDFVEAYLEKWGVDRWCATLERSTSGKLHTHLVLQFRTAVDRTARFFAFKSRAPNASVNDLLNEGLQPSSKHLPMLMYSLTPSVFDWGLPVAKAWTATRHLKHYRCHVHD